MTRRPSKPSRDVREPAPKDSGAALEETLAAHLIPPDTLQQLAQWRAKVAARFNGPASRKPPPKKKR
jgi:hypothetical protein